MAEAKANLTFAEAMHWVEYRDKHGSLNPMTRLEQMSAIVALQVNWAAGGKAELVNFMPNAPRPVISLDEAIEEWI